MSSEHTVSVEQEISQINMGKPHVVVLGAGASRATCPNGDKNGKLLPLMNDFSEILGLKSLLEEWGINSEQNFENIFSDLYEKGENEKILKIEEIVEGYFNKLRLPKTPTIYDHLVLSLRGKDIIATFNWDPLLLQAYHRNSLVGLELPKLAFLHGNVKTATCETCKIASWAGENCDKCGNPLKRTPLLYPVKKKDYAKDPFIKDNWNLLKYGFQNAFMITIFGYGAPKTDIEAIGAMQEAWGDSEDRQFETTTIISNQSEDDVYENWKSFIHSHHYRIYPDFYDSGIAHHPRRTGEAYWNQNFAAKFVESNPIPKEMDFPDLWIWFNQFKKAEKESK